MLEIVVDECLAPRIGTELRNRGRKATSVAALGLKGLKDGPLLHKLTELGRPWVLLTADDELPRRWGAVIEETSATVAIIHPTYPGSHSESEWHHDVAHRWAHVLGGQEQGTVRRYSQHTHRRWTAKNRR